MAISHLGYEIDSSQAKRAAVDLDAMTKSAERAEKGERDLARASNQAETATDQLARSSRGATTATAQLETSLDGASAASQRMAASAQTATGAMRTLQAANMNVGMAAQRNQQLMFQWVDIGQALATAPMMGVYALQNLGFQMAQIGQMYYGQGGMRAALSESAAMIGGFVRAVGPLALVVGAVSAAFAGLTYEINQTTDVSVSFGDTALATLQVISGAIYSSLQPAIEKMSGWFSKEWDIITREVKIAGNQIIGALVGAYNFVTSVWSNLGAAFSGYAKEAVNSILDAFGQDLLSFGGKTIIPGLDVSGARPTITEAERAAMSGAEGSFGDAMSRDYMGEFFSSVPGQAIENALRPTEDELKEAAKAAKDAAREAERLAESYDRIVRGADQFIASQQLERQTIGMTEEAANSLRYEQDLLNRAANQNIQLTPAQAAELKALAGSMAEAEAATTALERAFEFAKDTTKGFLSDFQSGLEQGKGMLRSFGDAAMGVLQKISDKLIKMAVDNLWGNAFSGASGGGGGVLSGILGGLGGMMGGVSPTSALWAPNTTLGTVIGHNANGTDNWRGGLSWVGERGPELLNLPRGSQVIPNHRLRTTLNNNHPMPANDRGPQEINVNVSISGARGSAEIEEAVNAGVSRGIGQFAQSRDFAGRVRQVNAETGRGRR